MCHFNTGPGNHAFYLMKQGLKQVSPSVRGADGKDVKPWLDQLEATCFYSAGHAVRPRETTGGSYAALALQQVDYAHTWGMTRQKQVECAWFAVGAFKGRALSERGTICPVADSTERTAALRTATEKPMAFTATRALRSVPPSARVEQSQVAHSALAGSSVSLP